MKTGLWGMRSRKCSWKYCFLVTGLLVLLLSDPRYRMLVVYAQDDQSQQYDWRASMTDRINVQLHGADIKSRLIDLSSLNAAGRGWGWNAERDAMNRPVTAMQYQLRYSSYGADFIIPTDEKVLYLTFDAGTEYGQTERVLDVLQEKNISAIFFCVGSYVRSQPDLVRRMIHDGHVVGNHSMTHPSGGFVNLSPDTQSKQIMDMHQYMNDHFQYNMYLFRAPSGEFSERTIGIANNLGYRNLYYSFAYKDWDSRERYSDSETLAKLEQALHPGAIYMLHMVAPANSDILPEFIDFARSQGYKFGDYRDTLELRPCQR